MSIFIDDYAFEKCKNLTTVTIGTVKAVNIDTGAFQECEKLEYLYLNKSIISISGTLPFQFAPNYHCSDGTCGCSQGYGNVHGNTSSLYRCMPSREGKTSGGLLSGCKNFDVGSYATRNASTICTLCPKGKYGVLEGGTFADMACKNCSVGSFAQVDGSKSCFECPAGSHCNEHGMEIYERCSPGKYNSYSNNTEF